MSVARSPDSADLQKNGRWIDLLLASLREAQQPVTAAERGELAALLEAMGIPADSIGKLIIRG